MVTKIYDKTAIGVNTFKKLVEESTIFVDKSLLIKEFVENSAEVLLVTCPRRWGKSINMDMIKTFLEIEVDSDGNKYSDKTKTHNYKIFQDKMNPCDVTTKVSKRKPLKIAKDENFVKKYQGEHPVISIDFKNVNGTNYQEIENGLKLAISTAFKQHEYMIDLLYNASTDNKSTRSRIRKATENLNFFEKIYCENGQKATYIDIETSLYFLSEVLHTHFNKEAYILMDNYDTPIYNISQSKLLKDEDSEKALNLIEKIMGVTFKGNEYLAKGLITGVFRLAKSSINPALNNTVEYNFLNNRFARYYGFTEDETKYLFDEYEIGFEDRCKAKSWYDGYRVEIDPTLKMYNPWAIINFLSSKVIKNYYQETGDMDCIKKLFKFDAKNEKIQTLLSNDVMGNGQNNHSILVELNDLRFSMDDFVTLNKLVDFDDNYVIDSETVDLFFRYIFAAGYLTITEEQINESITSIKLPNNEVKSAFEYQLFSRTSL
jgi:hypothetical protein